MPDQDIPLQPNAERDLTAVRQPIFASLTEDWWAVIPGAVIIFSVLAPKNLLLILEVGLVFLALASFSIALSGKSVKRFSIGFAAIYGFVILSFILAGNKTIAYYGLEYVVFALLIGLVLGKAATLPAWLLPLIIVLWSGSLRAQSPSPYTQEIESWHQTRINNLKAANGWLNLAGLFWLNEGKNSFGSDAGNAIVFPQGSIAPSAGYFERSGNTVKLVVQNNVDIRINGTAVKEAVIYAGDSTRPPVVSSGSLRWTIIRRDDKIGVRLRNLESPQATTFKDIERFPVDSTWKIQAILRKEQQPQTIAIANVLGQISKQQTPGKLFFTIGDKQYTLDALEEGDELFIIFADATNGKTTYPSGRFLSVKKPGADGLTTIDFNKAYDPPCAFTPYATCPLPPKQNVLDLAITAGEKDYGHH